jgi:hypothetical protein
LEKKMAAMKYTWKYIFLLYWETHALEH